MKEEDQVAKGTFVVLNEKGLHTRPSTEIVKCSARFRSSISLFYRDYIVNGKSLLGILMLAAPRGSKIKVEAKGPDAYEAVDALIQLAERKFHIKY